MSYSKSILIFIQRKLGIKTKDESILFRGSSQAFILKVFGLIVAYGLQVLLARVLKVEEYGTYVYVLTWANLIVLFTKLGFDGASKRLLPVYKSKKQHYHFNEYVKYSTKISFIIGISVLAIALTYMSFGAIADNTLKMTFIAGFILVVVNTQLGLITAFLEGMRAIVKSMLPLYYIRPILIAVGVSGLFILKYPVSSTYAMWINVAATLVSTIVIWSWFKPFIEREKRLDLEPIIINKSEKKEWRKIAFSLLLVSGTVILLTEIDTVMLGMLDSTTTAGVYQTAIKIGHLAMFGFNSIEMVIAPTIAGLYAVRKFGEMQNILRKGVVLMVIFTLPMIILLWFFGDWFLRLYGIEFVVGFTSLKILLACQIVNVAVGSAINLMIMTRYEKEALYILATSLVVNVILNWVLIPIYGMEGAAAATGITTILWNLAMYVFIRFKIKLDPTILSLFKKKSTEEIDF